MVMVAPDGTTVALKMLDGSGRAATRGGAATAGAYTARSPSPDVADTHAHGFRCAVTGGGQDVGAIRPAF